MQEQRGVSRHQFSGLPSATNSKWPFAVVGTDEGKKQLRLLAGRSVLAFEIPKEFGREKYNQAKKMPLARVSDLRHSDFLDGEVETEGDLEVHSSTPTGIRASFNKSTFMIGKDEDGQWTLAPEAPGASRLSMARDFVLGVERHSKTASDDPFDTFRAAFGIGPKYEPKEEKKHDCPKCGKCEAVVREVGADTSYNEMVLRCKACGEESDLSEKTAAAESSYKPCPKCGTSNMWPGPKDGYSEGARFRGSIECWDCGHTMFGGRHRKEEKTAAIKPRGVKTRVETYDEDCCPHCEYVFPEKCFPKRLNDKDNQEHGAPLISECPKCSKKFTDTERSDEEIEKYRGNQWGLHESMTERREKRRKWIAEHPDWDKDDDGQKIAALRPIKDRLQRLRERRGECQECAEPHFRCECPKKKTAEFEMNDSFLESLQEGVDRFSPDRKKLRHANRLQRLHDHFSLSSDPRMSDLAEQARQSGMFGQVESALGKVANETLDYLRDPQQADHAQMAVDGSMALSKLPQGILSKAPQMIQSTLKGVAKRAPAINGLFIAAEAVDNTRQGWGNAIKAQNDRTGSNSTIASVEGLTNPVTAFANIGKTTGEGLTSAVQAKAPSPVRGRQIHQQWRAGGMKGSPPPVRPLPAGVNMPSGQTKPDLLLRTPQVGLRPMPAPAASPLMPKQGHSTLAKIARAILRPDLRKMIHEAGQRALRSPSHAQVKADNYRMGHFWLQGLDITIETAKGGVREDKKNVPPKWRTILKNAYGRIRNFPRSQADGDHMDVFIGDHPDSQIVFVIDQNTPGGKFDEHKCMVGFTNQADAKEAYLANFSSGWKGLRSITAVTMPDFKQWLLSGNTRKPFAERKLSKTGGYPMDSTAGSKESPQQELFRNFTKKAFKFKTDSLFFPLSGRPALHGVAAGAALGSGAGLLAHAFRRVTGTEQLDSEGNPGSAWGSALRGGAAGAAVAGIFQGGRHLLGEKPAGTFEQSVEDPGLTQPRVDHQIKIQPHITGPDPRKVASMDFDRLKWEVLNDSGVPSWRQGQIIREIDQARSLRIELDPRNLITAGLGALAGWLTAKGIGLGSFGQFAGGFVGGALGLAASQSSPGTINGQGYYLP